MKVKHINYGDDLCNNALRIIATTLWEKSHGAKDRNKNVTEVSYLLDCN